MRRVVLTYFDAGGGHRAAATAICEVLSRSSEEWDVEMLNLQEHLDELDPVRKLTGIRLQDVYNRMLAKGITRPMKWMLPILHLAVRSYHSAIVRKLVDHWTVKPPDIVVSVAPNLNRAIALSLKQFDQRVPFVTVLTDFADTPPCFWIEPESQYLVCGTERAVEQALAMGCSTDRVFLTSGMVLHPRFYSTSMEERSELRARLGLAADMPVVLVMFGGEGSTEILRIAKALDRLSGKVQAIFICGRNENVRQALEKMPSKTLRIIEGFTKEVPTYMSAADVMIGKPGPGSISEALHFGLPVIVCRSGATMPQEVYNAQWVEQKGVGVVLRSFSHVDRVVKTLTATGRLRRMRENAARIRNRAIFEIEPLLLEILYRHSNQSHSAAEHQGTSSYEASSNSAAIGSTNPASAEESQKRNAACSSSTVI